jgi:hypothetical protein
MRRDAGVDRIGLRPSARGASKIAHLARIDTAAGKPAAASSLAAAISQPTAAFEQDAAKAQLL